MNHQFYLINHRVCHPSSFFLMDCVYIPYGRENIQS